MFDAPHNSYGLDFPHWQADADNLDNGIVVVSRVNTKTGRRLSVDLWCHAADWPARERGDNECGFSFWDIHDVLGWFLPYELPYVSPPVSLIHAIVTRPLSPDEMLEIRHFDKTDLDQAAAQRSPWNLINPFGGAGVPISREFAEYLNKMLAIRAPFRYLDLVLVGESDGQAINRIPCDVTSARIDPACQNKEASAMVLVDETLWNRLTPVQHCTAPHGMPSVPGYFLLDNTINYIKSRREKPAPKTAP